jgi:hypothetical protein
MVVVVVVVIGLVSGVGKYITIYCIYAKGDAFVVIGLDRRGGEIHSLLIV